MEGGGTSLGIDGPLFRTVVTGRTVAKLSEVSAEIVERGRSSGDPLSAATPGLELPPVCNWGEAGGVGWFKGVAEKDIGRSCFISAGVGGALPAAMFASSSLERVARSTLVTAPERRCAWRLPCRPALNPGPGGARFVAPGNDSLSLLSPADPELIAANRSAPINSLHCRRWPPLRGLDGDERSGIEG